MDVVDWPLVGTLVHTPSGLGTVCGYWDVETGVQGPVVRLRAFPDEQGFLPDQVDIVGEDVHTSHMTTSNFIYVVTVRDSDGISGYPFAVRTAKQDAIDIAVIYNADRYDRWAEVTEFDLTTVTPGDQVALPPR